VNPQQPEQLDLLQDAAELAEGFDNWDIFTDAEKASQPPAASGSVAEGRASETCRTREGDA
jgi:hypothetical protein